MNKVLLVGRIATDPTSRATTSNMQVTNFSVACNSSFSRNNQQNSTVFIPCVAWNNQANFVQTYLKKGSLVSIEGRISRRSYVSKQTNQTVYATEVVVENINSLSSNRSTDEVTTTNNAQTPSVSDIFPESSINNLEPSEQKVQQPKYDENDDLEWFDELEKVNK